MAHFFKKNLTYFAELEATVQPTTVPQYQMNIKPILEALVQWLGEETHVSKVVSSNPGTMYWKRTFFTYLFVQNLVCVFEKTKINEKETGDGPFL